MKVKLKGEMETAEVKNRPEASNIHHINFDSFAGYRWLFPKWEQHSGKYITNCWHPESTSPCSESGLAGSHSRLEGKQWIYIFLWVFGHLSKCTEILCVSTGKQSVSLVSAPLFNRRVLLALYLVDSARPRIDFNQWMKAVAISLACKWHRPTHWFQSMGAGSHQPFMWIVPFIDFSATVSFKSSIISPVCRFAQKTLAKLWLKFMSWHQIWVKKKMSWFSKQQL